MLAVPLHTGPDLPLTPDVALAVLGVGAVVFLLLAYDLYRRSRYAPGGEGWQ